MDKDKLYSLHVAEIECIAKGKVRQPYEFGVKVCIVKAGREGLVIGLKRMPDKPYDEHTLPLALAQIHALSQHTPKVVFVNRGYCGVEIQNVTIWRSGQKHGVKQCIKKTIPRRSVIEPSIGHMMNDG